MKTGTELGIDPKKIAIIGEYTTDSGPFVDDHFFVIVSDSGEIAQIPSENVDRVMGALETIAGMKIEPHLCNSAQNASRIIFPTTLAGHALFDFKRCRHGFIGFLKNIRSFGVGEVSIELTGEVRDYISRNQKGVMG